MSDSDEEAAELGLQAERTFLAWTRTALSFVLAGGVMLKALSSTDVPFRNAVVGVTMLVFGAIAAGFAWLQLSWEFDRHRQFTPHWALRGLALGTMAICAIAVVVSLVVRR